MSPITSASVTKEGEARIIYSGPNSKIIHNIAFNNLPECEAVIQPRRTEITGKLKKPGDGAKFLSEIYDVE